MNETKRLLSVFGVILIIVGVILLVSFWPEKDKTFICGVAADGDYSKLGKVDYKQYQCLYKDESKNGLIIADKLSTKEKKALNDAAEDISHALYYLDTENIAKSDLNKIKKELDYKNQTMFIIENKKVKDTKKLDLTSKDEILKYVKDAELAKFACGVKTDEEYENLGAITYEQYQCLYESDNAFALVLEQTTCGYCHQFNPILNDYVGEENLPVYTIQIDTLKASDKQELLDSLEYFKDNESWGTPLSLGIKNKEVVADLSGYTDDTTQIEEFFKKTGLKK